MVSQQRLRRLDLSVRGSKRALTLIEVLVVVAIISILAAILFPVLAASRASARRTVCISNLRQIGMAVQLYRQDYEGLPPHLSTVNSAYLHEPRVFVCPSDPIRGKHAGNDRLEGALFLPTGVSYDYVPRWDSAVELGWWGSWPNPGNGEWDDLTPLADCQWHWASAFNVSWTKNQAGAHGWQLVLTLGASVRKLRVESPIEDFTPEQYR